MIRYLNPRAYNHSCRYAKLRLIQAEEEEKPRPYHEVVNATPDVDVQDCKLVTVKGKYVNRLDLLANDEYGDPGLWWFIAKQNHIEDPTIVPAETLLQVPKFNSLMVDGRVLEPMSYVFLNLGVDG